MEYILSRTFEKQFAQLPKGIKTKAIRAFEIFVRDPNDPTLRAHALAGKWRGYWSINVTGDYRAVYTHVDERVVRFVMIGTHSQLYG
jgi:addiction module RelE/StbE family toxin